MRPALEALMYGTRLVLVALAVITVALVTTGIVIVHRHIERRIDQMGKL